MTLEEKALDDFANVEGRELRVVRAQSDVFQIEKDSHGGLGILRAHYLGDVREIALAKQEKVFRIRKNDFTMLRSTNLLLLLAALLAMSSCNRQLSEREDRALRAKREAAAPESTRQQLAYLDRIRQRDPFNSSIERTLLTEQSELGLVLSTSVTADKVPSFMSEVMKEMAQKFPKQDVTLTVFASSNPPRKIGTAHLNGQTAETSYTPL